MNFTKCSSVINLIYSWQQLISCIFSCWRKDTQYNHTQHDDTQHDDVQCEVLQYWVCLCWWVLLCSMTFMVSFVLLLCWLTIETIMLIVSWVWLCWMMLCWVWLCWVWLCCVWLCWVSWCPLPYVKVLSNTYYFPFQLETILTWQNCLNFSRMIKMGAGTFSIMTISITTFSIMDLVVTLSIKDSW